MEMPNVNPQTTTIEALEAKYQIAANSAAAKLCLRTSKKVYNQSLVATMIATLGEKRTEDVVRGWVANLATEVLPMTTP